MNITAILTVFRRPELLEKQIKKLQNQTIPPKKIWIWQNYESHYKPIEKPKGCEVIHSSKNYYYHGRFALALLADTEYIAVYDDDVMMGNRWHENCIQSMKKKEGLYVGVGRAIPKDGEKTQWVGWRGPNEQIEQVDYGGHAWFLKKEWLKYFWGHDPKSLTNAEDIQLSAYLAMHDILTYVPPHPTGQMELWCNTAGSKFGNTKKASHVNPADGSRSKNWFRERREIERELMEEGWETIWHRNS